MPWSQHGTHPQANHSSPGFAPSTEAVCEESGAGLGLNPVGRRHEPEAGTGGWPPGLLVAILGLKKSGGAHQSRDLGAPCSARAVVQDRAQQCLAASIHVPSVLPDGRRQSQDMRPQQDMAGGCALGTQQFSFR